MDISDILARLENGRILVIDDQMRSYVSKEDGKFVVRSVHWRIDDQAAMCGEQPPYDLEESHDTLAGALLSLVPYRWIDR